MNAEILLNAATIFQKIKLGLEKAWKIFNLFGVEKRQDFLCCFAKILLECKL